LQTICKWSFLKEIQGGDLVTSPIRQMGRLKGMNDMRRGSTISAVLVTENLPAKINLPAKVQVVIIHAVPLMRLGLEAALIKSPAFSRCSIDSFASLGEAGEILAHLESGALVLFDLSAWSTFERPANGPQISTLKARGVTLALVASADHDAARLLEARGLSGVVAPDADLEQVATTAEDLVSGRTSFPQGNVPATTSSRLSRLSSRQFEILELMTRGLLNKQIAWELGLTEGTVKSHVSAILEKLGCDRRTQAIAAFMQCFGTNRDRAAVA
jgi:DNA-binding NarL/FixJ family response regulator